MKAKPPKSKRKETKKLIIHKWVDKGMIVTNQQVTSDTLDK